MPGHSRIGLQLEIFVTEIHKTHNDGSNKEQKLQGCQGATEISLATAFTGIYLAAAVQAPDMPRPNNSRAQKG